MSEEDTHDPFKIEFTKVEKQGFPLADRERYKVTFEVSRRAQDFSIAVYVDDEQAVWEEVVRLAMHQLHHDFAQLARQTDHHRLAPDQIAKMV